MTNQSKTLLVKLSDRPPVKIDMSAWPCVAKAKHYNYDGEHDFQANHHWRAHISVRRHDDGRHLVYGTASYDTSFQDIPNQCAYGGYLLAATADVAEIVAAIHRVADSLGEVQDIPAAALARECIADLPAEEI